ncbi:MAG: zf-TFIIB domain-containing protein [Polyangiales bacterium]
MNCPRCRGPLVPHQAARLVMNCCHQCGGVFLDGGASKRVVEALDPNVMATASGVSQQATAQVATEATIGCPMCNNALERLPIPAAGVTVDACREHGIWFDRDELQRVVQAVAPPGTQQQQPPPPPSMQQQPPPPPTMQQGYQPPSQQQPYQQQPYQQQVYQPPPQQPPAGQLAPGMAPGQYVAPGWLDGNQQPQSPFGFGGGQQGAPPPGAMPGAGAPGGMPGMPGQPQAGGEWGLGKTALAVGGGLAAVAGVAYVASHTHMGQQAMGTHQSGFGAVGEVLSKLF